MQGSAVAVDRRAVLILGPSGSGKSGLALWLVALGAALIGDDLVTLRREDEAVIVTAAGAAAAPQGLIEARGIGLIAAGAAGAAPLSLIVDLGRSETERLPPLRVRECLGVQIPLVLGPFSPHLVPAVLLALRHGRVDPAARIAT